MFIQQHNDSLPSLGTKTRVNNFAVANLCFCPLSGTADSWVFSVKPFVASFSLIKHQIVIVRLPVQFPYEHIAVVPLEKNYLVLHAKRLLHNYGA